MNTEPKYEFGNEELEIAEKERDAEIAKKEDEELTIAKRLEEADDSDRSELEAYHQDRE